MPQKQDPAAQVFHGTETPGVDTPSCAPACGTICPKEGCLCLLCAKVLNGLSESPCSGEKCQSPRERNLFCNEQLRLVPGVKRKNNFN